MGIMLYDSVPSKCTKHYSDTRPKRLYCIIVCLCVVQQYKGDPVSLAISEAVLNVVEGEGLAAHAEQLGGYLLSQLRTLASKHPCIGDVRYIHTLICCIHTHR